MQYDIVNEIYKFQAIYKGKYRVCFINKGKSNVLI